MNIVFLGKGGRSVSCLRRICNKGYRVNLVVGEPQENIQSPDSLIKAAKELNLETIQPEAPNSSEFEQLLKKRNPDLFILAGYGKILRQNIINIPRYMCINLHAGKLPKYRGSSPLNWALINGDTSFALSVIKVDSGVDTGDIILERTFPISIDSNICDLHAIANKEFPLMLEEVVEMVANGSYKLKPQDDKVESSYYPLRFPEDGIILWDTYTAIEIYNRIRALTEPYPCAYTFFNNRKVKLISAQLTPRPFYGEPGRVYKKSKYGILVCALDRCLLIKKAFFEDDGESLHNVIKRYDKLATLRQVAVKYYCP